MSEFWQTIIGVSGILFSVTTGGVIVAALSAWLGKVWAERLMVKETAKYREELERLTKQLEQKNYVSKVRFDAEFSIYRDLSAAFLAAVQAQNYLFTKTHLFDRVPKDKQERKEFYTQRLNKCGEAWNVASTQLYRNAPFIDKDIFDRFSKIHSDIWSQISNYPTFYIGDEAFNNQRDFKDLFDECSQLTLDINSEMDKLISDLRAYLKSLDVA